MISTYIDVIRPYIPYILTALPFIAGVVGLIVRGEFKAFINQTIAAVYRVALATADEVADDGIGWLRSEEGISYRKRLAGEAYDLMPAKIGSIPFGSIVRALVSKDDFCAFVEHTFCEMVELAEKLRAQG